MKMRIRGNSIRLRLTQSEVKALHQQGIVEEKIEFSPGGVQDCLRYTLEVSGDDSDFRASYSENTVRVVVPTTIVADFATTDQVSMTVKQDIGDQKSLRILIEKDFACLAPREGDDDSDTFPHPKAVDGDGC